MYYIVKIKLVFIFTKPIYQYPTVLTLFIVRHNIIIVRRILPLLPVLLLCLCIACKKNIHKNADDPKKPCTKLTDSVYDLAINIPGMYGSSFTGSDIAYDAGGNAYVTGYYGGGTIDINPGSGTLNVSGGSVFVEKLDAKGAFLWGKSINSSAYATYLSITVDAAQNCYVTWSALYQLNPPFPPYQAVATLYITKIDAGGTVAWTKAIKKIANTGASLEADNSGSVYITSSYTNVYGTVDFDPGPDSASLTPLNGTFLLKLDASGNFLWVNTVVCNGAANVSINSGGNLQLYATINGVQDIDPGSAVYNAGSAAVLTDYTAQFNPKGNFLSATTTSHINGVYYGHNIYVLNLDTLAKIVSGNVIWQHDMHWVGNTNAAPNLSSLHFAVTDADGNIYLAGQFNGKINFDPKGAHYLTSDGIADDYIEKIDASGNFVWVIKTHSSAGYQFPNCSSTTSMKIDANGNIYTTGYYDLNIPGNNNNIFITKLSQCK